MQAAASAVAPISTCAPVSIHLVVWFGMCTLRNIGAPDSSAPHA
jgi:hypothetical protein